MLDGLWITDGGPAGNRLEVRLASCQPLELYWPPGMRGCEFTAARTDFELARGQLLEEIQARRQVSDETSQRYITAVDQLLVKLEDAYPRQQRADFNRFEAYHNAKRYLQNLVVQGRRAASDTDPSTFNRTLTFQGNRIVELIRFMNDRGIQFAHARPGGEGAYRTLLMDLRNIYLEFATAANVESGDRQRLVEREQMRPERPHPGTEDTNAAGRSSSLAEPRPLNQPPTLWPIEDVEMKAGEVRRFRLAASDPDAPGCSLRFSLVDAPRWVFLDASTGVVTCVPGVEQTDQGFYVIVRVTDSGVPPETDDKTFAIAVLPPPSVIAGRTAEGDGGPGLPGAGFRG